LKVLPETEVASTATVTAVTTAFLVLASTADYESVAPPRLVAFPLKTLPQPLGSSTPKKSNLSVAGVTKSTVKVVFPLAAVPVATTDLTFKLDILVGQTFLVKSSLTRPYSETAVFVVVVLAGVLPSAEALVVVVTVLTPLVKTYHYPAVFPPFI